MEACALPTNRGLCLEQALVENFDQMPWLPLKEMVLLLKDIHLLTAHQSTICWTLLLSGHVRSGFENEAYSY